MNLGNVVSSAVGEMSNKRLQSLYQKDFLAWQADVLGLRTYRRMGEICEIALFGDKNRTAIKSSNGVSKTFQISAMIQWAGSAFDIGETLSIITAPSQDQVKRAIWGYMKDFRKRAAARDFILPGWLDESMGWKTATPEGNVDIAFGKVPPKGDEVSIFQGTRSTFGKTYVFVEEAGGVTQNLFVAAEAVLTGDESRGFFIGNPDHVGGPWQKLFTDPNNEQDWNRFTLNYMDLPWYTGETVYPDDPEMEAALQKNLTTEGWVEQKKRMWGEKSPWFLSKALGQFPEDGGTGFFTPGDVGKARDTEIEDDMSVPCVFGLDIARMGLDESVLVMNRGGKVTILDAWAKTDTYTSTVKVFEYAQKYQPVEIRVDATGVGGGVLDNLVENPQFAGPWDAIGIEGALASPDITKWANLRAYIYDSAKTQMAAEEIDIDGDEKDLLDELSLITYKFHNRGGVQIARKEDMKTALGGSPDRADAFVYAVCDLSPWTGNPWNEMRDGEAVIMEREDLPFMTEELPMFGAGLPLL